MSDRDLTTSRSQVFGHVKKGTECRICGRDVDDGRAKFCSEYCRSLAKAVMNLLNWSGVRRIILNRDDETCQECGFRKEWEHTARGHIRDIIDEKLPDRPEGPSALKIGSGEIDWDEDDWSDHYDRLAQWREQREELRERYGQPYEYDFRLEVDHFTPISEGGHPFDPANLRTLCSECHREKTAEENRQRAEQDDERPEVPIQEYLADAVSSNE